VVTLWTSIPEALGSSLGQDIGYLDLGLPWIFAVPPEKCENDGSLTSPSSSVSSCHMLTKMFLYLGERMRVNYLLKLLIG
jgi:hypothetical protein